MSIITDEYHIVMQKAYTLIELLVVIAIIGLMAGIGIPAYSQFGKDVAFRQKSDEVKELINQAYTLSKNPADSSVKCYGVRFDNLTPDAGGGVVPAARLYKSNDLNCLTDQVTIDTDNMIQKVVLEKDGSTYDQFVFNTDTALDLKCPTDFSMSCQFDKVVSSAQDFSIMRNSNEIWRFALAGTGRVQADSSVLSDNAKFNVGLKQSTP
ncbi:MAG: type II secretion system protein [Candidatus Berkelbacteria bacterium]